jgi:predicted MFS family arabinose efflux permease
MPLFKTLVPQDFRGVVTKPLKRFYLCTTLSCVGSGLTLSFFVVYLHNVQHFSVTFATLLLAITAIAGLAISPLSGTMVDRFGPVVVIVPMFLGEAGSLVLWAFARQKPQIIVAALFLTCFRGGAWVRAAPS